MSAATRPCTYDDNEPRSGTRATRIDEDAAALAPNNPTEFTQTQRRIRILVRVFDEGERHSLPVRLREMEAKYRVHPYTIDTHSLVGLCATFGLNEMMQALNAFELAPSENALSLMWVLIETTRQRLQRGEPVSQISSCTSAAGIGEKRPTSIAAPLHAEAAEPLVCVGIDDDRFMRAGHASVFSRLGATASTSLGQSREEQIAFVSVALGLNGEGQCRPADVVLIDQCIDIDGEPHMIGTSVVDELRGRGYRGVIVIVTGACKAKLTELRAWPGVDLAVGKSAVLSPRGLVEQINCALAAKGRL